MKLDSQYTNQQEQTISFEVAVRKAYYQNKEVSRYLGYSQMGTIDLNYKPPEPFDLAASNKRVWGVLLLAQLRKSYYPYKSNIHPVYLIKDHDCELTRWHFDDKHPVKKAVEEVNAVFPRISKIRIW
jgi:hypothetical protein